MALEMARAGMAIAGAAGFHSGLSTQSPPDSSKIEAAILVSVGADDPHINAAQRSEFEVEMRSRRANWRMNLYGGVVHSFTNVEADSRNMPDFARYDADADKHSWNDFLVFLEYVSK